MLDINKVKTGLLDGKISVEERDREGKPHIFFKMHGREMFMARPDVFSMFKLGVKFMPELGKLMQGLNFEKIKNDSDLTEVLVKLSQFDQKLIMDLTGTILGKLRIEDEEGGVIWYNNSPDVFFRDPFELAELTFLFVKINFIESLKWRNLGSIFQGQKTKDTKAQ